MGVDGKERKDEAKEDEVEVEESSRVERQEEKNLAERKEEENRVTREKTTLMLGRYRLTAWRSMEVQGGMECICGLLSRLKLKE